MADRAVRLALNLDVSGNEHSPHYRAMALAHLCEHLPAHSILPVGLQLLGLHGEVMVPALRKLASRMSGAELHQMMEAAETLYNDYGQAKVLLALAPQFPEPGRREVLQDLHHFAQDIDDPLLRCQLTILIASCLPEAEALPVLADAHAQARLVAEVEARTKVLTDTAGALPPERRAEVCYEALAAASAGHADDVHLMGRIALAASPSVTPVWQDFWRPALHRAAGVSRVEVARQVADAARDIVRLGAEATPAAVMTVLDDVIRWWP
ncbi:hypothetical protein SAMN06272735_0079 [Streptomyces sp. TLI_55]|uniref:hypothetical protein n=1 Tax=Streptomyces sp. TLI_55 TaxID=1938861 RepID=UPI000BDA97DA|nr:hypothetical protein [Streptomyces sp. TLI_55]SNX55665.1 hypothetical protein SAMN06272735_0079 [Streptomyces sp. TLI_55]